MHGRPFSLPMEIVHGFVLQSYLELPFICLVDGKNSSSSKQRYSRKRENSYPKNEGFAGPTRRSGPQKSKTFNKVPPQRGVPKQFTYGRREEVRAV